MISELFIENYPADISADISSLLTLALDDVKDFASRQTTFSKTVVLPGTSRNNALLGNIFDIGHSNPFNDSADNVGFNFNAAKSARCLCFQDSIQAFKGTLRLLQINIDRGQKEYEVALSGELFSLNVALSGALLEDLDFSAYDHTYSQGNIEASWDNPGGSGYYYPLIDYGTYSTGKHDWDIRTFRPALYVKEYLDKMFEAANFRYSSDLFETSRFKSLIIPHNQKVLTASSTELMEASLTGTLNDPINVAWDTVSGTDWALTTSDEHIEYSGATPLNGNIRVRVSGEYKFQDITVKFFLNGVEIHSKTYVYTGGFANFFSYDEQIPASMSSGDYITCVMSGVNQTSGFYRKLTLCTLNFISNVPAQVEVDYLDTISMNDTIPKNVRQIDFLTSIVKLFNLYIREDQFDKNLLHIEPYVDFYSTDSGNAVDWSYKLNRDEVIKIIPMSELNSKIYNFNYKDDSDYYNDLYKKRYNQGYGSYIYDSQFEFTSQSNTLELIFSSTPLVGYGGEEKIYPTIFKLSGTTEEKIDSNIRIMQTKKVTGVASWDLTNDSGATTLDSYDKYGYAGHLDDPDNPGNDLNFGAPHELFFTLVTGDLTVNQFGIYWSPYMAEITDKDSKMLIGKFYLTPKDIFSLDFSKYVYVDGVLFRLNKITDYNLSKPSDCEVRLLKVINTLY